MQMVVSHRIYRMLLERPPGTHLNTIHTVFIPLSHIMGMFYRTIRMLENGIKPVYVFDGKPPDAKYKELAKRSQRRQEAVDQSEAAREAGNCTMIFITTSSYYVSLVR